jgi:hypothetical protein
VVNETKYVETFRYKFEVLVGNPEEKRKLISSRRRRRKYIKHDLNECVRKAWTGLIWLRLGTSGGLL